MYKFVVLAVFLAVAAAAPAPGYLGGYGYGTLGYPLATSYQNRVDVHDTPITVAYAKPVYGYASYGYPGYAGLGYGHSYGYGGIHGYGGAFSYGTHSVHPY